jgi:PAS domain-containing protein
VVSVFAGRFPDCFVEGSGLTQFKVSSEYVICVMLLAAVVLLARARESFDPSVLRQLGASILLTMAAELSFTLYADVYGLANVTGHLLRFLAVCFIYRAIIVTGLVRPYDLLFRDLTLSEEALRRSDERYRAFVARTSEGIFRLEIEHPIPVSLPAGEQVRLLLQQAYIAECNDAYARMRGAKRAADVIGARPPDPGLVRAFVESGYRMPEAMAAAGDRWIEASVAGVVENGRLVRAWGVLRDVTERRNAALERERLIAELQHALAEVKTLSGLLPICANCKKIRDDRGYWTQVESYLEQRTKVAFSHGICPGCMEMLYPEYYSDIATAERR